MSSGARLVTRSVRPGAAREQLGEQRRRRRAAARSCRARAALAGRAGSATSASGRLLPGVSPTPSASAIAAATSSGSLIGASSTSTTPSGNSSPSRSVASTASRVFPVPPGPVRVSRRTSPWLQQRRGSRAAPACGRRTRSSARAGSARPSGATASAVRASSAGSWSRIARSRRRSAAPGSIPSVSTSVSRAAR